MQKLIIRRDIIPIKVSRDHLLGEFIGMDNDEAPLVGQECDMAGILWSYHDPHEYSWEGGLAVISADAGRCPRLLALVNISSFGLCGLGGTRHPCLLI